MNEDKILFYESKYYMFSNFSSFAVEWRGVVWMTSEHAYQAAKFEDSEIIEKVKQARSAYDAKTIARSNDDKKIKNFTEIKIGIMEDILRAKLAQHNCVRDALIETGNREIVENSHRDAFWGRGPDWQGRNELGKVWMKLRSEIQNG